jgi:multiple sugar transport system ATP-binding protein
MADITFDHVAKWFPGGVQVIDDLDLRIEDGEFMVLVGPSGSGKSTALRIVAGLEQVTTGRIRLGGDDVTDWTPRDRDIAMVFQNYALYPHMTVEQNMGFALKLRNAPPETIRRRVNEAANMLALGPYLRRKPSELSGGQRQRVAIGRAIVREPRAFLMDEPLSNLDAKLRVSMRATLAALHERLSATTLYVTHDQIEAMTLGDRVAVLDDGRLQQCDTPQALFDTPANLFVAGFIGSPAMNTVVARLAREEGAGVWATFGRYRLRVPESTLLRAPTIQEFLGREVIVGIRPSSFENVQTEVDPSWPIMDVTAVATEELGSEANVIFEIDAPSVSLVTQEATAEEARGEKEDLFSVASDHSLWTARVNPHSRVRPRSMLSLAVDIRTMHFFDPDSGESIAHPDKIG